MTHTLWKVGSISQSSEDNDLIPFPLGTPLCRLCGRLDDLISEPTRAVGATVTVGTVILIGLPRMAR